MTQEITKQAASAFGRLGGKSRSTAKAQAARQNLQKANEQKMKTNEQNRLKRDLQSKVCDRAYREIETLGSIHNRSSLLMDLDSLPDLDLQKLLDFPAFDFTHDICGIVRHMDRSSYPGKLQNCFVPRATKSTPMITHLLFLVWLVLSVALVRLILGGNKL